MPIPFECSSCHRQGQARDELAGRIVKCPACMGSIEITPLPVAATPPTPPEFEGPSFFEPPPPPTEAEFDFGEAPLAVPPPAPPRPAVRDSGFLAGIDRVLDFRLRRYATPYLLRFLWCMTLALACLMLLLYAITQLTDGNFVAELLGQPSLRDSRKGAQGSEFLEGVGRVVRTITQWTMRVYTVAVSVFSVRVFLESLMVLFNIAGSLTRVEERLAVVSELRE